MSSGWDKIFMTVVETSKFDCFTPHPVDGLDRLRQWLTGAVRRAGLTVDPPRSTDRTAANRAKKPSRKVVLTSTAMIATVTHQLTPVCNTNTRSSDRSIAFIQHVFIIIRVVRLFTVGLRKLLFCWQIRSVLALSRCRLKYDYRAELTGLDDRSEVVIK